MSSPPEERPRPLLLDVEVTTRCQNRCVMCPRDRLARPARDMTSRTFARLVAEIGSAAPPRWEPRRLDFTGFGECLLHPELPRFVRLARETLHIPVGITTNGLLLEEPLIEQLLDAGVTDVNVSIHAASRLHEAIATRADFSSLLAGVRALVGRARGRAHVCVAAVEIPQNREHLRSGAFARFWRNEGVDAVEIFPCHSRGGNLQDPALCQPPATLPTSCALFGAVQFIAASGDLLACCSVLDDRARLGSILETPLVELLERKDRIGNPRRHFAQCHACPDHYPPDAFR